MIQQRDEGTGSGVATAESDEQEFTIDYTMRSHRFIAILHQLLQYAREEWAFRGPDVKNCDDTPQNECCKKLTTFFW
jgi:hypothetical protein